MNTDIHLVMVTKDNNNKFYDMHDNDNGTFTATWGRIGVTSAVQTYPIKQWNSKYKEKIKKGYTDQSALFVKSSQNNLVNISDTYISTLVNLLQQFAQTSVSANYTVDASVVTQAQVDAAQACINELVTFVGKRSLDRDKINDKLLNLYAIIPRRMKKVQYHLLNDDSKKTTLQTVITNEQDTLDVMAGQVSANTSQQSNTQTNQNILDVLGLQIEGVDPKTPEYKQVAKMMGSDLPRLEAVYRVSNLKTEKAFTSNISTVKNTTTEYYWHGSRNENWWSILQSGLLVRPSNAVITGKMFGHGIYGADRFQKSYGYTSGSGSYWARGSANTALLGVFEFHMGATLKVQHHESWMGGLTYEKLRKCGDYDSLSAFGGYDLRNSEYIVYQDKQLTIRYLVKIRG